jgi:hypothetical protein
MNPAESKSPDPHLGKQFYVENQVGADGNLGMGNAARLTGRLYDSVCDVELCRQSEPLLQGPI